MYQDLPIELSKNIKGDIVHYKGYIYSIKGWGFEKWIVNNNRYCCKLLSIEAGKKCSWHYHVHKDETFYVLLGQVELFYIDINNIQISDYGNDSLLELSEHIIMTAGDKMRILPNTCHMFRGMTNATILEVSTTHEESDSYRLVQGD